MQVGPLLKATKILLDSPTKSCPFSQDSSKFITHVDPVDGAQGTANHVDSKSGQESDVEEMSERNHDHSTTQGNDESIHADQGTLVSHLNTNILGFYSPTMYKFREKRASSESGLKILVLRPHNQTNQRMTDGDCHSLSS